MCACVRKAVGTSVVHTHTFTLTTSYYASDCDSYLLHDSNESARVRTLQARGHNDNGSNNIGQISRAEKIFSTTTSPNCFELFFYYFKSALFCCLPTSIARLQIGQQSLNRFPQAQSSRQFDFYCYKKCSL